MYTHVVLGCVLCHTLFSFINGLLFSSNEATTISISYSTWYYHDNKVTRLSFCIYVIILIFSYSPPKYPVPIALEKEFSQVETQYCTPDCTPSTSPLSSPPRIERLRLFDTPYTPKSLLRRSSMTETEPSSCLEHNHINTVKNHSMR